MAYCPYEDCEQYIDVECDETFVTCPKCHRDSEVNVEIILTPMLPISEPEETS